MNPIASEFVENIEESAMDKTISDKRKPKKGEKGKESLPKKILDFLLPLCVSGGLLIWLVKKVDVSRIIAVLHEGVDFRWLILMMGVLVLSHVIRGIRWGMQLRAAGVPRIPVATESVSIFGAYALNLVFSYLGEAWRCVYISRLTKTKITTVIGTDLGDRASDLIVVILLVIVSLFVAQPAIDRFMEHYEVGRTLLKSAESGIFWAWVVGVIALLAVVVWLMRKTTIFAKIKQGVERMWSGFAVLFHMPDIWLYIVLTFGIWGCYFMETYICFQAFPFTRTLITDPNMAWGLVPGLVVFVFGSCSIAIPSSGGLGPWNLAVMFALSLYGIPQAEGATYSLVVWGFESGTLVLLGLFSAGYVYLQRRRTNRLQQEVATGKRKPLTRTELAEVTPLTD